MAVFASFGHIFQKIDDFCFNFSLHCFGLDSGRSLIQLSQLNSEELHLSSLNQSNYTAAAVAVVSSANKNLENAATKSSCAILYVGIQECIHTSSLK